MMMITISDLVIFLGFCDRHSLYDQEKRGEAFSHTIKRARSFIQREYEELLRTGNPTGAIFALKNFGCSDRQEITGPGGAPLGNIQVSFIAPGQLPEAPKQIPHDGEAEAEEVESG